MIKYYQLDSIRTAVRTNKEPGPDEGWIYYCINPVTNALKFMVKACKDYCASQPKGWGTKPLVVRVINVKNTERAVFSVSGRKQDIEDFIQQTAMSDNFSNFWAWQEVDKIYAEYRI